MWNDHWSSRTTLEHGNRLSKWLSRQIFPGHVGFDA